MTGPLHEIDLGSLVQYDDPRREPRLIGNVSWASLPVDSLVDRRAAKTRIEALRDSALWGELVVDCPCEECQANREKTRN